MNIFIICPVRNVLPEYRDSIEQIVAELEKEGNEVYYPARDTNQDDWHGYNICTQNLEAIKQADVVYVIWDKQSQGAVFDLGMAFALRKKIHPVIGFFPGATIGKSFQNMVYMWQSIQEEL